MAKKDMDSEIENRISFRCSKKWNELEETDDARVKLCNQCNESVRLAENMDELDTHAEHGRCVMLRLKKDNDQDMQGAQVEPCTENPEEELPEIGGYFFRRDDEKDDNEKAGLNKLDIPIFLGRLVGDPSAQEYEEPVPEKEGWLTRLARLFRFK